MKKTTLLTLTATALLFTGCGSKSGTDYSKYVTLPDYKDLTVERYVSTVTDEDVQEEIQYEREADAEYIEVTDRAAKDGDYVVVDYTGTIDGEEFDGGSETDAEIELGYGMMLEDFESGIVGMKIGETKDITLTFPEEYDEEIGGKEAVFSVTLKSISEIKLPEYNNDFVAEISDYSTTEEYEAHLKETLQASSDEESQTAACESALQTIIDTTEFKGYPEEMYESEKASLEQDYQDFADMLGEDDISVFFDDGSDLDTLTLDTVNQKMVVYTLAAKEKLTVSDKEYESYLEDELAYSEYDNIEDLKANTDEESAKYELLYQKVLDFLGEHCTFVDVEETDSDEASDDLLYEEDETDTDTEDLEEDTEVTTEEIDTEITEAESSAETENVTE